MTKLLLLWIMSLDLVLKWYFSGLAMSLILGFLASLVYKPGATRSETPV